MQGGVRNARVSGTVARICLLLLLLFVYIHNQWTRFSIVYAVNFAVPRSAESAREFMNIDLGFDASQYGLMASYGFTLLYTAFSLIAGRVADTRHKGKTLALACSAWSSALILQGLCTSYAAALACRVVQGIAMAFTGPQALSLLADTFPAHRLATANSVYTSGVYFGAALASLSIVANSHLGWRTSFILLGAIGCALAVTVAATVHDRRAQARGDEEQRDGTELLPSAEVATGRDDPELPDDHGREGRGGGGAVRLMRESVEAMGRVVRTKEVQWALAAGGVRFCAGYGVGVWTAPLFRARFPLSQASFAGLNAAILAVGGFSSSLLGGVLSDRLGGRRARLLVPAAGCFLAVPAAVLAATAPTFPAAMVSPATDLLFYCPLGQWIMAFLAAHYLVAECWIGPFVSFLTASVAPEVRGSAQGMVAMLTLVGNLSPLAIGFLYSKAGVQLGVAYLGCVCTSYVVAGSLFVVSALRLGAGSPPSRDSDTQEDAGKVGRADGPADEGA